MNEEQPLRLDLSFDEALKLTVGEEQTPVKTFIDIREGKVQRIEQEAGRGGWRLTEPEYNRRKDDV